MSVLPPPLTLVGKIHAKHGFDGRLTIECFSISNKIIQKGNYLFVIIDGKGVPFCISEVNKNQDIIKFTGINTEAKAKALVGLSFGVPSTKKMSVITQTNALVGFVVHDEISGFQGKITEVETLPQGVMFTTIGADPNSPVLIPLVEAWITRIDEKTSSIYMELPEGLVELNQTNTSEE